MGTLWLLTLAMSEKTQKILKIDPNLTVII